MQRAVRSSTCSRGTRATCSICARAYLCKMADVHAWSVGDHLTHRFNPELGTGRVTAIEGRALVVHFPRSGATLRLAANSDALVPEADQSRRRDGSLLARLAAGEIDETEDFLTRLDILHLLATREASGLGSFLGGRVRLFPHQLYVAERATARMPVRWLLADEVGLGKTIEAALIMNRLLHTQKIERCLVIAPEALTVQWLGELWRKYHQVFTLLDSVRLADVAHDFGGGFNPFDAHRRAVIALETLIERPELTGQAVMAGIDLLVVDEAQRLRRPPGHPGEPGYRAIAPITALGRHVLLLSATPLEDDAHGFFRLLQLLRPEEFPEGMSVEARLESGVPLPPCTSSTRRVDIGGLPPRAPVAVDLPSEGGPHTLDARRERHPSTSLATTLSQSKGQLRPADANDPRRDPVARRRAVDRIRRALASGAALKAVLDPDETELRQQARAMDRTDPRLDWLLTQAKRWRGANEKTLVFVAHRETLEMLRDALSARAQLASGVFHEELSAARRDTEVARFRADDGPSILVSTEAGGEGRNFEFCHRLVLYDLPWKPSAVEQRIGRLDRIGRRIPVEILYFRPASGIGRDVVRLFERLGLFREPMAGVEPQLAHLESALEDMALDPDARLSDVQIDRLIADAQAARTRIREAAYQQLHRDAYRAELGPSILARVPGDLDPLIEQVVVNAASRLGFRVEQVRGRRAYAIEFGNEALIDSLPGVPGGSSFIGSFDREYAVENETIDFFASGHPLIEGLLAHFEEDPKGRVARVEAHIPGQRGAGVIAIYKDGPQFEVVAFDADGRARPDWADAFRRRPLEALKMKTDDAAGRDWPALVARVVAQLGRRRPYAVLAVVVRDR
jgi:ATP-dependent helicase HepA